MNDFIRRRNPVLVLGLGLCPAVAVSTHLIHALALGLVVLVVLIGSNLVRSLLWNAVSGYARRMVFLVTTGLLVTVAELLFELYMPELRERLGIFLPLTAVNCMILDGGMRTDGPGDMYEALVPALGMGVGFTAALSFIALCREVLGAGTVTLPAVGSFSGVIEVPVLHSSPIGVFSFAVGGFIVLGYLEAFLNWLWKREQQSSNGSATEEGQGDIE
jgi:electron transport complex protein RnfE